MGEPGCLASRRGLTELCNPYCAPPPPPRARTRREKEPTTVHKRRGAADTEATAHGVNRGISTRQRGRALTKNGKDPVGAHGGTVSGWSRLHCCVRLRPRGFSHIRCGTPLAHHKRVGPGGSCSSWLAVANPKRDVRRLAIRRGNSRAVFFARCGRSPNNSSIAGKGLRPARRRELRVYCLPAELILALMLPLRSAPCWKRAGLQSS